jgi:hypothetical protein
LSVLSWKGTADLSSSHRVLDLAKWPSEKLQDHWRSTKCITKHATVSAVEMMNNSKKP